MDFLKSSIPIIVFLLFSLPNQVAAVTPLKTNNSNLNGFDIYVKKESQWDKSGFLSFEDVFAEKYHTIRAIQSPVIIRLVKKGIGTGHIDMAVINSQPPVHVTGVLDQIPLHKLGSKDFDVIHVGDHCNAVELTFPQAGELRLSARVEGERISKTPFRFPKSNNYTTLSERSDFFTVPLQDKPSTIFSEITVPSSGHPAGQATGSAIKQDDNLHIRLDFESDNTRDDSKDYASVHIRTNEGVKTYTVTQNQRKWGTARFCYTPESPWQHKVYDFYIPLTDLGNKETIELAMSAYGTASLGGNLDAAAAYGSNNKEYMAAYYYTDGQNAQVRTQRIDSQGTVIGNHLNLTSLDANGKGEEAVGYNPNTDQFLIAWIAKAGGINAVHTMRVSSANGLIDGDPSVLVTLEGQRDPVIGVSPANNSYFLAWQEKKSTGTFDDIYGNVISHDNQSGANIIISNAAGHQSRPAIGYNPSGDRFYLVWQSWNGSITRLYGRIYGADGTAYGIASALHPGSVSQSNPAIAVDPALNKSLLVWEDERNAATSGEDIYGGILGNGLLQIGESFPIASGNGDQLYPRVVSVSKNVFLVTWEDRGQKQTELRGRFLSANGSFLGGEKVIKKLDVDVVESSLVTADGSTVMALYQFINIPTSKYEFGTEIIRYSTPWKLFLHLPAIINGK